MTLLSDRVYLAITIVVVTAGDHRALPVDAVRARHPSRRGIRDRCVRQRHLARSHRAVELDARRRGRRRSPGSSSRRCRRWCRTPTPCSWCRRSRPRSSVEFQYLIPTVIAGIGIGMIQAWLDLPVGQVLVDAAVGRGRDRAARRDARRAAGHRPGGARARRRCCDPISGGPRGRGRTRCRSSSGSSSAPSRCSSPSGSARVAVIITIIYAILALSLVVVTGYAGQVSLAQLALAGVGAFMLSYLTRRLGRAVPDRAAPRRDGGRRASASWSGLPALRLRGLTLGVVTFALAFGIEAIWFRNTDFVELVRQQRRSRRSCSARPRHRRRRRTSRGWQFGFMCLIVLVLVAFGVARLRTSAFGSAMLAVRANERSAAGHRRQRRLREGA